MQHGRRSDRLSRRLVFTVTDHSDPQRPIRAVVVKLVISAELTADFAQMIAADRPRARAPPSVAFPSTPSRIESELLARRFTPSASQKASGTP
jgi:hypothetical protein